MRLLVTDTPNDVARTELNHAIKGTLDHHPRVRLGVPGGSAMRVLPDVIGDTPLDRLWLTWVDERCVPPSDDASNRGALHRALDAANVRRDVGFELPLFLDGESPEQAVSRVRAGLRDRFDDALDVALLGMGADGHIASLFGPSPARETVIHVADSPKPPASRVSLTRSMIATAATTVLLAVGESKRDALTRLVKGDESLPAHGLPGLVVVTDLEIASGK